MLNALHHRVVLDQARDLIIDRYGFNISDLRLGGHRNQTERQAALRSILDSVRNVMSAIFYRPTARCTPRDIRWRKTYHTETIRDP